MKILGISPLDKDASASAVEDGRILFAAGEERFSRRKQHAGFPQQAVQHALDFTGWSHEDVDEVAYAFLSWEQEAAAVTRCFAEEKVWAKKTPPPALDRLLAEAVARVPERSAGVHGLSSPNQRMRKGPLKEMLYRWLGLGGALSAKVARRQAQGWEQRARADHHRYAQALEQGLREFGLEGKLRRYEHHLSHAANAYLTSGFERALIVTIDGYGTGLAGSVSLGESGKIRRLHSIAFPHSLGVFYESVTSSMGFHPDRHAGKIVGLAAYGDPAVLRDVLLSRVELGESGDFRLHQNLNIYFSRHLAAHFPMIDVAAAYQDVLEHVVQRLVAHWAAETGCDAVVLSGGVTANVKMNQRVHEAEGVRRTYVYPNMGDGGCGSGIAMHRSWPGGAPYALEHAYWGPSYTDAEIEAELEREGLEYFRSDELAREVATRIHSGEVIARFAGRMEYGPRALGNRSILYHAREPEVNQWLNQRLGRTEFMPFAPVTKWEARERCYLRLDGAEHAAQFMTVTFDCTEWMKEQCPAAVHVDGTARPQLVRREINPGYYDILDEYEKLSGIPCLINTSFNMHEEPIVCTPADAVRAFLLGHLDGLAIGPFFVPGRDLPPERRRSVLGSETVSSASS